MKSSYDYRAQARRTLNGHWNDAIPAMLIYFLIVIVYAVTSSLAQLQPDRANLYHAITVALSVFLIMPMGVAIENTFLRMARGSENTPLTDMLDIFRSGYERLLPAALLMSVIVGALAIVTFGILGVVFSYAYCMMPYLLEDYPDLSPVEALKTSRQMMRGHKMDLFVLDMTFIGWVFLALFTGGIGVLWLEPYIGIARAHFYEDLKAETIVEEKEQPEEQHLTIEQ